MASTSYNPRPPSPSASSQSALPATASYYQQSIRQKSLRSRSSVSSAILPVDDEIAEGLGEESHPAIASSRDTDTADTSEYNGFLPARDKSRTHSILPSSAFFAPRKPPQALSQPPISSLSPINHARSSDNDIDQDPLFRRGEPAPLDRFGRERVPAMRGRDVSLDAASSLAIGRRSSSDMPRTSGGASTLLAVDDHRQGDLNGKASRDYLLDKRPSAAKQREQSMEKLPSSSSISKQDRQNKMNRVRRYKAHQGANRFYIFGLIMTSDDNPLPFVMSLAIMVILPILWFVFVAPFTWQYISPAPVIIFAYIWAISASSMIVTAWRDPGVLPRDLDPDPPCTAGEDGKPMDIKDRLAIPLPRVIRLRNGTDLNVKWCDTCGTYRPPRSSHCRVCDNCVENIDHHCTFLNTCIGRRNYFSFFAFLFTAILACFLSIIFSILHIYYLTVPQDQTLPRGGFGQGKNFGQALKATPLSAVIFLLSIAVVLPVMVLFVYHVRLVCMNRTTVEQIRINATSTYSEKPNYEEDDAIPSGSKTCLSVGIPGRDPNPFAYRTIFRNVRTALLRPMTAHSWIDRYHYQKPDNRNVNPGHGHN